MSGLFGLLETTKLTIFAQEMSLGILNHNIANANTPGYHRQRVALSARGSLVGLGGTFGGGVNIEGVERLGDRFLSSQLGRVSANRAEQSALADSFSVIETIFGEPADDTYGETGLGDAIDAFLNAWQPVVNPEMNADDADTRGLILEAANTIAHRFRDTASALQSEAASLRERVEVGVREVNDLLSEVAELNLALSSGSLNDSARADFEDTREVKLQRLSALIGAEWQVDGEGKLRVYSGGRVLVDHVSAHALTTEATEGVAGVAGLRLLPEGSRDTLTPAGGALKGLLGMLDTELPEVLSRLDVLATRLMERVNAIHQAATGDGGGGIDIFSGSGASSIAVNPALLAHPEQISLTGTLPDGQDIAAAIFALHTESIESEGGLTLGGLYSGLIGHLGSRSASSSQLTQAAERLEAGLSEKLESSVGVSIDEEMAQMLVVQTTYQAAAKVITAVEEMLDVLMAAL